MGGLCAGCTFFKNKLLKDLGIYVLYHVLPCSQYFCAACWIVLLLGTHKPSLLKRKKKKLGTNGFACIDTVLGLQCVMRVQLAFCTRCLC